MKIIEKIVNVTTGEENIVERDMNVVELAEFESAKKAIKEKIAIAEEMAEAKKLLLDKLGITEEEAKLLLS